VGKDTGGKRRMSPMFLSSNYIWEETGWDIGRISHSEEGKSRIFEGSRTTSGIEKMGVK